MTLWDYDLRKRTSDCFFAAPAKSRLGLTIPIRDDGSAVYRYEGVVSGIENFSKLSPIVILLCAIYAVGFAFVNRDTPPIV